MQIGISIGGYRLEEEELQAYKDRLREQLLEYTRKAFRMLPEMKRPRILDIGCGSGIPTMELAKLSNGQITAIDINRTELKKLVSKIEKAGLTTRLKVEKRSMLDIDFPDASFDLIWAEGSINVIGFEKGLRDWRRLLTTGGFLVIHDELGDFAEKQGQISQCGYKLINHFVLSEEVWGNKYFVLLEKELKAIRVKHTSSPETIKIINDDQREIDTFKQYPERYRSVFFIIRKSQ